MRNIVESALARGLVNGYLANKTKLMDAKNEDEEIAILENLSKSLWDELDYLIDFTDDEDGPDKDKAPVGFASSASVTDAVSSHDVIGDDEDDATLPEEELNSLRRLVRYHKKLAQKVRYRSRRS